MYFSAVPGRTVFQCVSRESYALIHRVCMQPTDQTHHLLHLEPCLRLGVSPARHHGQGSVRQVGHSSDDTQGAYSQGTLHIYELYFVCGVDEV